MNDKEAPKRSPNFPSVSLEDSLANIRIVYERDKLAAAKPDVIVAHLGYNKLHGTSRRVLAAMKSYGLLDELADGRFKVSDTAFKLLNSDLNSPKAVQMLKEAVLKPAQFRTVIEENKGELPSDTNLSSYLVLEKSFTPDGALAFIQVLRANVEFANITTADYSDNAEKTEAKQEANDMLVQQQQTTPTPLIPSGVGGKSAADTSNLPTPDTKETILNFKISRKSEARIIFYGEDVTREAVDQLKALLEVSKAVYPTKEELEAERVKPRQAIWKNKDHDQPVEVTGEAEEHNGRKFVAIAGSDTRIPEDELEFKEES